VLNILV